MKILTKKQILTMHTKLIQAYGGADGLRDEALLDAAIHAPFQSFDGIEAFPTLFQKAARLCFGVIKNHPFIDGNKRTGTLAMLTFLSINNVTLTFDDNELLEHIINLAAGVVSCDDLAQWLIDHHTP